MPTASQSLEDRLAGEQKTLALPLRSLLRNAPVTCTEDLSVRAASAIMHEHGVGSVVVVGTDSRPVGIFTERDLLRAVAQGMEAQPVAALMTREPFALPGHAFAYEAALAMIERRIRHVLVTDEDQFIGVVSGRDLFSLLRLGLGELTTEIDMAGDVATLKRLSLEILKLARLLVSQGVAAEQLTYYVSVLNDRLCQRVIEVVGQSHGCDDIDWCWLVFGSEGRFEQTFSTDQDNGIIFVAHDGSGVAETRERLLPFATAVNEALDACGFRWCKGNIMASNPELCLSAEEWRDKMGGWLENWDPKALLEASIYFDFRPLHGNAGLATSLRGWIQERTKSFPVFLRQMAQNALLCRPALGIVRDFVTEDVAGAPHSIDLKAYGARLFVDVARIHALAQGLPQTNTVERLRAAGPGARLSAGEVEAAIDAFLAIQRLRLRLQAAQDPVEEATANRIDPEQLNEMDRQILKQSFRIARRLQKQLSVKYQL